MIVNSSDNDICDLVATIIMDQLFTKDDLHAMEENYSEEKFQF